MTPQTGKNEIQSLIGLRGGAVLLIVLYHLQGMSGLKEVAERSTYFFTNSTFMVDLFFALSGYLLMRQYFGEEARARGRFDLRGYAASRFVKIYPMYLFALIVFTAVELTYCWTTIPLEEEAFKFVSCVLLIQSWNLYPMNVLNSPAWFVSALFAAYLATPVVAALSGRRLKPVLYLAAAIGLVFLFTLYGHHNPLNTYNDYTYHNGVLRGLADVFIGMALFTVGLPCAVAKRCGARGLGWLQALLAVALGSVMHGNFNSFTVICMAILFLGTLTSDEGFVARWLSRKPILFLGRISYSVFLMHHVVISLFYNVYGDKILVYEFRLLRFNFSVEHIYISKLLSAPVVLATVLLVGALCHHLVEKPLARYFQNALRPAPSLRETQTTIAF